MHNVFLKLSLLCVFLFVIQINAQQRIVDSLLTTLHQYSSKNASYIATINDLVYYYSFLNPDKGIKRSDEAIRLSKALQNEELLATAYSGKAVNLSAKGLDTVALSYYDKVYDIRKAMQDELGMAKILYNKGLIHFKRAEYRKANENNREAYIAFEKQKDSFLMAKMLNSIGINHMYLSEYPQALDTYTQAALFYEKLELVNQLDYGAILSNMGLLYEKFDEFKKAQQYQERAMTIFKAIDYKEGIANCLTNIGNLHRDNAQYDQAIAAYEAAHTIMKEIDNMKGIANALTNIGITEISINQLDNALIHLKATQNIYTALGDANNLSVVHRHLGTISFKKNRMNGAISHLEEAIALAQKTENIEAEHHALEELATVFFAKSNYKKAFTVKEKAQEVEAQFLSSAQKEEIARLEANYEYEKEKAILQSDFNKEQAIAEAEITKQRDIKNTYVWTGGILLFVGILLFFLWKQKRTAQSEKKEAQLQSEIVIAELRTLRMQMNPHFIFNTLNSIRDYVLKNDKQTASTYLTKFAQVMRQTLNNSQFEEVSLQEEIKFLETYMNLEKKRLINTFEYNITVDDTLESDNTLIPPLLLQPFIENSIWHGISKKTQNGLISIAFTKEQGMLICSVDDNGVGLKHQDKNVTTKKSLGIHITQNRLSLLNKLKNTAAQIAIFDKPEGVRVEIKLPLSLTF